MHELSVMSQAIESIMKLAMQRRAQRVLSVHMQVGELTFLSHDQLEFGWQVLTANEGPPIEGAELTLEALEARGVCPSCGYTGALKVVELPDSHYTTPVLDCPSCGRRVDVTEGRDLIIRDIQMEVHDDEAS